MKKAQKVTGMAKDKRIGFLLLFLTFILSLCLYGCNITYLVRNQHNELSEALYFPCGKVNMELRGKGNSKFIFFQQFDSDNSFAVNPDSLRIYFNHEQQTLTHKFKAVKGKRNIIFEGVNTLETSFEVAGGVFEGDTIRIFSPGYVICHDEEINLDTIVFTFINNFRIYGINE